MRERANLSPRAAEIARLAAEGMSCAAIAERLSIAPNTVKYHLKRIYRAFDVRNRAQLANSFRNWQRLPKRVIDKHRQQRDY